MRCLLVVAGKAPDIDWDLQLGRRSGPYPQHSEQVSAGLVGHQQRRYLAVWGLCLDTLPAINHGSQSVARRLSVAGSDRLGRASSSRHDSSSMLRRWFLLLVFSLTRKSLCAASDLASAPDGLSSVARRGSAPGGNVPSALFGAGADCHPGASDRRPLWACPYRRQRAECSSLKLIGGSSLTAMGVGA